MPIWLCASLALVLTSCSLFSDNERGTGKPFNKPKIHLHFYSDFTEGQEHIIAAFTGKGYDVIVQKSELPSDEAKSFIIHSPSLLNPSHQSNVEDIVDTLKDLGILEVNQYQYFLGRHSYTPNHVGVYLL